MSVPELRFPEFEGEWEDKKLGECLRATVGGGTPSRKNDNYWNGKIPWASVKDFDDYKYQKSTLESITEEGLKNSSSNLIPKDNLIISTRMGLGKGFINKIPISINQDLKGLIPKKDVYVEFLYYWYKLKSKYIETLGNGSTVKGLRLEELHALMISIPTIKEQEKIASFLSAVDEKIEKLEEKQVLWEAYKKGMMQKIFSQELRFKDENGDEYPEWEERKLCEISIINPKANILPDEFVYIDLESVDSGILKKIKKTMKKDAPSRAKRVLENNDILYQTVRPYQKNNLFFQSNNLDNYVASTGYAQIRAEQDSKFLYHLIHTKNFVNNVLARCTGTSYPAINSKDLGKIKIFIPSSSEQKKIASFLSRLDEKIEMLGIKLEFWENYKKGLLQKMFC